LPELGAESGAGRRPSLEAAGGAARVLALADALGVNITELFAAHTETGTQG